MVARAEIYEVADGLVAERKSASVRAVRERLANGGSHEDISPILADWRRDRNYFADLVNLGLNDDLAKALAGVVTAMKAAIAKTGREDEARSRTEPDPIPDVASTDELRRLRAENATLRSEIAFLRDGAGAVVGRPKRQDGTRARGASAAASRRFWDAVMEEIYGILSSGPLTPAEILARLSPDTAEFARLLSGQDLSEAELREKMVVRVNAQNYFARADEDRFERRRPKKDRRQRRRGDGERP